MNVYTLKQCWEILRHYFENHANIAECMRKLSMDFGRKEAPLARYVRYLVKKVKETGSFKETKACKVKNSVYSRECSESVCEAPSTSLRRRSQQLNFSETSLKLLQNVSTSVEKYKKVVCVFFSGVFYFLILAFRPA